MGKYLVKERSFINNRIVEAGTIIDYEGDTHHNLEANDGAAKKEKRDEDVINAENKERLAAAAIGVESEGLPTPQA